MYKSYTNVPITTDIAIYILWLFVFVYDKE